MAWFKLDDGMHNHPKFLAAGNAATGLWSRCGSYCSQHATEGLIPTVVAKAYGTKTEIARLVDVGLWTIESDGYRMHDYLDYNPDAAQVRSNRQAAAERQKRARDKAAEKRRESQRDGADSHAVSHAVTEPIVTRESQARHGPPDPTRPDPSPSSLTSVKQNITTAVPDPPVTTIAELEAWNARRTA